MERAFGRRKGGHEQDARLPVGIARNVVLNDHTVSHYLCFAPTTLVKILEAGEHNLAPYNLMFLMSDGKIQYDGGRLNGGALIMGPRAMKVRLQSPAVAVTTDAEREGMELNGTALAVDGRKMLAFMRKTGGHGRLIAGATRERDETPWHGGAWGFELRDGSVTKGVVANRKDNINFTMDNALNAERDFHSHSNTTSIYVNLSKSPVIVVEKRGSLELVRPEVPSVFMVGPEVPHLYIPLDRLSYALHLSNGRQIRYDKKIHDHTAIKEDDEIRRKIADATGRATRFG